MNNYIPNCVIALETCATGSTLEKPSRYVFKLSDYEKKTFAYSKKSK